MKITAVCMICACFCSCSFGQLIVSEIYIAPSDTSISEEYVELFNPTTHSVDLTNWTWSDSRKQVVINGGIVEPNQAVVLSKSPVLDLTTIVLNPWPGLNNDTDSLTLLDPDQKVIQTVVYHRSHWRDLAPGLALHNTRPLSNCLRSSKWKVGKPSPGTFSITVADQAFSIKEAILQENQFYIILDSTSNVPSWPASQLVLGNDRFSLFPTHFDTFWAVFEVKSTRFNQNQVILELTECAENTPVRISSVLTHFRSKKPQILINEVLFDPFVGEMEFIELLHSSHQPLLLDELILEHRTVTDTLSMYLIHQPTVILPQQITVLSKMSISNLTSLTFGPNSTELTFKNFPNLRNYGGEIVLRSNGEILDQMTYDAELHHPQIRNSEGVSLQRISVHHSGTDPDNWTSSSGIHGYATPGWNYAQPCCTTTTERFWFTPNGDGIDDALLWTPLIPDFDYIGTAIVTDAAGRTIKSLFTNQIIHPGDLITWNGDGDNGQLVPMDNYIVRLSAFHPSGKRKKWTQIVALIDTN